MSKKRKRKDDAAGEPPSGTTSSSRAEPPLPAPNVLPLPIAIFGAGVCAVVTLIMIVLFVRALPDAASRAVAGAARVAESACAGLRADPENPALGTLPAPAPDFTLKDYAGHDERLSDLRGDVVLVNFWATWCGTCTIEMPSMEKLVKRMSGKPFRLLAVSVDDGWDPIRKFFAKGTPLEILLDQGRDVPKRYGTEKFPESFLIDRSGKVRYYIVSNRDWSTGQVQACIDGLIEESP